MNGENHRLLREMLGAFALGQLPEDEQTSVRAHLDGCPDCRAELAYITPAAGLLRHADPERVSDMPAPPPGLGDRIVAAVRTERAQLPDTGRSGGAEPTPITSARSRRGRMPRTGAVAAAVAALAIAGGAGYLLSPKPPELPLEPVAIQQQAPGLDVQADLVAHTWGMEIKLNGSGFDQGDPYRVRVTRTSGDAAMAGAFVGTGGNAMACNLNSAVLRDDAQGFEVLNAENEVVLESSF